MLGPIHLTDLLKQSGDQSRYALPPAPLSSSAKAQEETESVPPKIKASV